MLHPAKVALSDRCNDGIFHGSFEMLLCMRQIADKQILREGKAVMLFLMTLRSGCRIYVIRNWLLQQHRGLSGCLRQRSAYPGIPGCRAAPPMRKMHPCRYVLFYETFLDVG